MPCAPAMHGAQANRQARPAVARLCNAARSLPRPSARRATGAHTPPGNLPAVPVPVHHSMPRAPAIAWGPGASAAAPGAAAFARLGEQLAAFCGHATQFFTAVQLFNQHTCGWRLLHTKLPALHTRNTVPVGCYIVCFNTGGVPPATGGRVVLKRNRAGLTKLSALCRLQSKACDARPQSRTKLAF